MTKEETKQRIAVMQAYVDGKQIQVYETSIGKWFDTDAPSWITSKRFRIKSEPSYRPFRNAEECWQEMLEHVPFGWITDNEPQNVGCSKSAIFFCTIFDPINVITH